ncbi:MAG TPA: hypothetical protein PKX05_00995 [bacterium]|nr:hypothetical protein [bacterium]
MKKIMIGLFFFLFLFSYFSFADEFKVTISGYNISIDNEKGQELWEFLKLFPLKGENISDAAKEVDKNFVVEKEFEFSFNCKDNVLTIVEPVLEWGKIHLEINIIPQLINDVIVEFNIEEYPKEWEEKIKNVIGEKKIPDEIIEENREKTRKDILKRAKEENWDQKWLQIVLEDMEKNYNLLKNKQEPKSKLDGGRANFKLGKNEILYNYRVQTISKEGKNIAFSDIRTILIERR